MCIQIYLDGSRCKSKMQLKVTLKTTVWCVEGELWNKKRSRVWLEEPCHTVQNYYFTLTTFHFQEEKGRKTHLCGWLRQTSDVMGVAKGILPSNNRHISGHNICLVHQSLEEFQPSFGEPSTFVMRKIGYTLCDEP